MELPLSPRLPVAGLRALKLGFEIGFLSQEVEYGNYRFSSGLTFPQPPPTHGGILSCERERGPLQSVSMITNGHMVRTEEKEVFNQVRVT